MCNRVKYNGTVSERDIAISLHTPVLCTVLHEKFQFSGVGGGLLACRVKAANASVRSSNSGGGGILGKVRTKVSTRIHFWGGGVLLYSLSRIGHSV